MKKFILTVAINLIAIGLIQYLFEGVVIVSYQSLLFLAITLTLLNRTVKPILKFISFPITFLTLGLFSLVINTMILELSFYFIGGATIENHWISFLAAMVISIVHSILNGKK